MSGGHRGGDISGKKAEQRLGGGSMPGVVRESRGPVPLEWSKAAEPQQSSLRGSELQLPWALELSKMLAFSLSDIGYHQGVLSRKQTWSCSDFIKTTVAPVWRWAIRSKEENRGDG